MSEIFRCGDEAGLLSYAYDDCEPAERMAIAAHVATCASCADVLSSIAGTRRLLASWTPPDARLGFRITADEPVAQLDEERRTLVAAFGGPAPQQWWRQPLPAWAQLAAAAVIFGVGLTVGMSRSASQSAMPVDLAMTARNSSDSIAAVRRTLASIEGRVAGAEARVAGVGRAPVVLPVASVTGLRPELSSLETRIAALEAGSRTSPAVRTGPVLTASTTNPGAADPRSMERMFLDMLAETEQRQDQKMLVELIRARNDQRELMDSREAALKRDMQQKLRNIEGAVRNTSFNQAR